MTFVWLHRLVLLVPLVAALSACGGNTGTDGKDKTAPPAPKERLTIVCTTPIIREIVVQIVGDKHDVVSLIGYGEAPTTFDLRPGDVQRIQSADLVLTHGLKYEGAMLETIATHATKVVSLADGVHLRSGAGRELAPLKPEYWADARLYQLMMRNAADALAAADPKNEQLFANNAAAYEKEMETDLAVFAAVNRPEDVAKWHLVTNREAIAQLANFFGLTVHYFPIDATTQPVAKNRAQLMALVKESKARVIAIDPGNNSALAEMLLDVAKSTGARVMSPPLIEWPRDEKDTYSAMMKANIQSLVDVMK